MSSSPALPDPADRARQRDEDTQYYRGVLHELVEMAADIARAVHRQATAEQSAEHGPESAGQPAASPAPAADPTIAFDRIARTLRRTIALARKLAEPAPLSTAQGARQRRLSARKQIIRAVEDTIQRQADGPEAEGLHAELYERLDDPDLDDDLDQLSIADIIAAICRDLGIEHFPGTHPWKRRTPQDVRDLRARAAGPSIAQPRTGTAPNGPARNRGLAPPDQHRPARTLIRTPGHDGERPDQAAFRAVAVTRPGSPSRSPSP